VILAELIVDPRARALALAIIGPALALVLSYRVAPRLAARTDTLLDDAVLTHLKGPLAISLIALSWYESLILLKMGAPLLVFSRGLFVSLGVVAWIVGCWGAVRAALAVLLARPEQPGHLVRPRTAPVIESVAKLVVAAMGLYFLFDAWHVDVTAWLASAGIIGVAVGFAAQESLGNLVAGFFILAEAPYKLGDMLILANGHRGKVTDIGLRTTRLQTLDGVEIIVPNQHLANAEVLNESGGSSRYTRIALPIGVAYGSDVAQVREVLLTAAHASRDVHTTPAPAVLFTAFGESSLDFVVLVWALPQRRPAVTDAINTAIYDGLARAGIAIPFPQRDVWIRHADASGEPLPVDAVAALNGDGEGPLLVANPLDHD